MLLKNVYGHTICARYGSHNKFMNTSTGNV